MEKTFLAMQKCGDMYSAFHSFGSNLKHSTDHINSLLRSLPAAIKKIDVVCHPGESDLYYNFADAFSNLPDHGMVFGGPQLTPIKALYWAIHAASAYMNPDQKATYLGNLGNSAKHLDYLFEARPFFDLKDLLGATNEVPGDDRSTIDWLLRINDTQVFIECKFRVKTAVANFTEMIEKRRDNTTAQIRLPITNPENIFRSTGKKFQKSLNNSLNGIWISSVSGEDEDILVNYFENSVDTEKVQFFILSGWSSECFILTRTSEQKQFLLSELGLVESSRFTFRRNGT